MIVGSSGIDLWVALLVVGIVVSFVTVVLIAGGGPARRASAKPPALATTSAAAVKARASARAAEAAAQHRSGHLLRDVRVVQPPPDVAPAAGQATEAPDDPTLDQRRATAEALAVFVHLAEHDPRRIAEVISQWIKADQINDRSNGPGVSH